jgi:phosphoglycolate phosphatase-like HAD superfamily hydrolase
MIVFLFDIDGTLLSSGGAGKAALETGLTREFGLSHIRGQVPYSGRTDRAIISDLLQMHDIAETPDNWHRLLNAYLRLLPECLHRHEGRVLPGIAALLEHLGTCRDRVAVGLLTGNVRAGANAKLGHFGLEHHFAFGGFGDDHLDRCDVARSALAAAHGHLDGAISPERVWVIGDTPLDIACARAIGAKVAAVATGWHDREELASHQPNLLFDDLNDPSALLVGCGLRC